MGTFTLALCNTFAQFFFWMPAVKRRQFSGFALLTDIPNQMLPFHFSTQRARNAVETGIGSEQVNISLKESKRRGLQVLRQQTADHRPKVAMRIRNRSTGKAAEDLICQECAAHKQTFQYIAGPEQMYHQHQQQQQFQSHSQNLSSRPSLPPEKNFLLQDQGGGDSGLILSTDAKPRLKWTSELHERFVEAVHQLGGPDKATPKTIMRAMGIPGLTLYHLKSHLQKYRLGKNLQAQANAVHAKNVFDCTPPIDKPYEGHGSPAGHLNLETQTSKSMHISEALQMQIDVQRRLHEQLEVQRHLQLRIEAQGKYLQSVLEKAQEALAKPSVAGGIGLEAPIKPPARRPLQNNGSVDSCLTACEGSWRGGGDGAAQDNTLSIGLLPAAAGAAARRGAPAANSGASRDVGAASASREEEEEYCYLFLGKPEQHQQRREIRRDDVDGGVAFETAVAELDLSINVGVNGRRPPHGGERIDLNGSGWN